MLIYLVLGGDWTMGFFLEAPQVFKKRYQGWETLL